MSNTTYDYDNQAWLVDGVYQDCNHPDTMDCKCYGRINKGKRITSKFTVEACYNAELNLWTGGLPEEVNGYLLTKEAAARVFDGEVSIDDLQADRDYIPQSTACMYPDTRALPENYRYEIDQLRALLKEVSRLTQRVVLPDIDANVHGWQPVAALRIEAIKRVITEVQTALGGTQ